MAEQFDFPGRTSAVADVGQPLNAEQRAAVEHGEGPLLVVAGAGTGKTRVITERIRHLLESDPELPGESILGLTFTEKAAGEMRHRVAKAVGERGKTVCLDTFNAFCNSMLLERNPQLKTLETVDHWILLRRNLQVLELEHYRRLVEPGHFLGDFVRFFSRCQDELVTPDDYTRYAASLAEEYARERSGMAEDERRIREEAIARQQEIARAYRASDRLLRERNLLTFGMQLMDAVHALDADPEFAARQRGRFRYILVDEFQDTNVAQIELLWRLANEHRNIVAVGDNAQAIYRFRGASFGSFTIFLERFAGVPRNQPAAAARYVQPLVDNYRSSARILRVAGQVTRLLEHSPLVPDKGLVAHKSPGEKVRIVEFASAKDEARWIAGEIDRLHGAGKGASQPWNGFAALYRIHGHREALVEAIEERGIPFRIRNLSILDHPLVRDILAYLRLIVKPADSVACARALAAPAWGVKPEDLMRLCERAKKNRNSLWETLQAAQGELPFENRPETRELVAGIEMLRERAKRALATDLFEALADWLDLAAVPYEDRRCADRLRQFLREWQQKSETSRIAEFVEYLDYFAQAGGQINLEQEGGDAVQLMTVHAAKGLEFDHVFILRLTQRCFPLAERRAVLEFPEALMKEELPKFDFHTQEERRLFYVAVTRARERLTLTTVVHKRSKPSLFLDDLLSATRLAREDIEQAAPAAAQSPPPREPHARNLGREGELPLFAAARGPDRVRSRISEWARQYRPPVFSPFQLSVSAIEAYQRCPQRYLFSGVWRIPASPHAATTFGNVMHTTIKQFAGALKKGHAPSWEDLAAIFSREWVSAGFEDRYQEEAYRRDGFEQLRGFYERMMAAMPDIMAQEKPFVLLMENGVELTGRMDQINRLGPGEIEIVDYKTGKSKSESQAKKDLQLSVYALAAREEFGLEPVRLVYHNLQSNELVSATRDERLLAQVSGVVQEVAADIRAREFPPQPGHLCRTCEFRFLCPEMESGRTSTGMGA